MSLAPLIVSVTLARRAGAKPIRVILLGVAAGVVYFAGTLYWIGGVMAQHGGLPDAVAYGLMLALSLHLALFVGLFAWLLGRAVGRFGLTGVWLAPWLWVATEWLRAWLGWNFPWVLLGSSQASVVPVVQLASVTGVYGLSALIALVSTAAAVLALSQRPQDRRGVAVVGLLVAVVIAGGAYGASAAASSRQQARPLRVGLLQGNVRQDAKWDPAFRDAILDRYVSLSRQAIAAGAQLVHLAGSVDAVLFRASTKLSRADPPAGGAGARTVRHRHGRNRTPVPGRSLTGITTRPCWSAATGDRATRIAKSGSSRSANTCRSSAVLFFVGPLIEAVSDFTPGSEPKVFDVRRHALQRRDLLRSRVCGDRPGVRRRAARNC